MKKNVSIVVAVIVVIAVVVLGIMHFHKSSTPASTTKSSTASVNNAVLVTKSSSTLGNYLATPGGMALYTYGADTTGVSNCKGSCLSAWPAYVDSGSTTGLPTGVSTIKRTDNGQTQYTYNGKPLYTFASDSPGQATGNGVSDFSIAVPAASSSTSTSTSTSSSTSGYNY